MLHHQHRDDWSFEMLHTYLEHLSRQSCLWEPQQAIRIAWVHETINNQEEEEEEHAKEGPP